MHILIDTCDWIELGKNLRKLRRKLIDLAESGMVIIVLPDIVEAEWQRHKEKKIIDSKRSRLQTLIAHTKEVLELLPDNVKQNFSDAVSNISIDRVQEYTHQDACEIDDLFSTDAVVRITPSVTAKSVAADLALEKKAPFFENKNSMADALILLSFLEFVRENDLAEAYFISNNTDDFADTTKNQIHPDLVPLLEGTGIKYFSNIGLAINEIQAGVVSAEEIEFVERINQFESFRKQLEQIGTIHFPIPDAFKNGLFWQPIEELRESLNRFASQQLIYEETLQRMRNIMLEQSRLQETFQSIAANTQLNDATLDAIKQAQAHFGDIAKVMAPTLEQLKRTVDSIRIDLPKINIPVLKIDPSVLNYAADLQRIAMKINLSLPSLYLLNTSSSGESDESDEIDDEIDEDFEDETEQAPNEADNTNESE